MESPRHRIVSLLPSATEIVCALGFADQLVGRSHECDYPPDVKALPALTAPKFDPQGSSAAIDETVKRIVAEALSVYRVDTQQLRALQPDVIVTQSQCEVCAVSMRDVEEAVAEWIGGTPPKIISLAQYNLGDVLNDIGRVAMGLGVGSRGIEYVTTLSRRMSELEARAKSCGGRPRVACIEWIDPLMAAGNWMPELVAMAGGENLFGAAGAHAPWIKFDDLAAADPETILLMPCGYDIARTLQELPRLTGNPLWARLRAVREGKVFVTDGNQFFNRPGPRIVESLEILCEILHPEAFAPAHRGAGWREL
ncbi:MAG TPA: cobalamin-binding protein [Candidatus Binataceae bacterium]|jgi:iron complex transport system substrate-binding protein|nr:cobalamin-binding protein [Candidatus Binataceae bacterium]